MIKLSKSLIVDCCNKMLDGDTMEESLDSWENRIVENLGESLDRKHAKQKIKERIKKYKKYDSLEASI